MDKTIRNIARRCAIAVFFIMAVVGWFFHQEPAVCAWRGILGAVVMYLIVRIAGGIILNVLIDAIAESEARKAQHQQGDKM